jgi:hypothetical protein
MLDLALAEAVAARECGEHRLQIRAETPSGNSGGKIPTGGYATSGTAQAMESVLVDRGLDLGQFGDLVNPRSRVITDQGVATAAAVRRPAPGDRAHLLRWDQAPQGRAMSRLPTPFSTGGWGGRLAFQSDGVGRRGLGGIGGIALQAGLQIADAALQLGDPSGEGVKDGQEGKLGFQWDGLPQRFRDGRLRDHAYDTARLLHKRFGP